MADLAALLLRTTARAFYTTEHVLVIDALLLHSTLQDSDLAFLLNLQTKHLRKLCGKLREDGLLSVQSRAERRADGTGSYFGGAPGAGGKERLTYRDWYYLNFHRAIDSIKYRMWRLSRQTEMTAAPATERKELACPRCKSEYTQLEVMDQIDPMTGGFMCHRCGGELADVDENTRQQENEGVRRLNSQLERMLGLMQKIDGTTVPENSFEEALQKMKAVKRGEEHVGARMEVVDLPNGRGLQSVKGLEVKPEKIAVSLQDDETVRKEAEAEELRLRREKEARANALPEWISKSTVSGDITAVGAKEERLRREREAHGGVVVGEREAGEDRKEVVKESGGNDEMDAYWAELREANAKAAAKQREEDEEEDEEDDDEFEFEAVGIASAVPALPADPSKGEPGSGVNSSNATDDERDAKRQKTGDVPASNLPPTSAAPLGSNGAKANGTGAVVERAEDTPAASDEDEDDLQFEDV